MIKGRLGIVIPTMNKLSKVILVCATLAFLLMGFCVYLELINQNTGFQHFKNLEYGTDLEVVVAPHGIYTYKYVHLEYFCECKNFDVFVNTANFYNATVYWEGNNGSLFWFYLGKPNDAVTGIYYKVPLKWLPDDTMRNCTS